MGPLSRLNHFFWEYKHLFVPGLLFTMISAGFQITVPMVVRQAVDSIPRFVRLYTLYEGTPAQTELYAYFFVTLILFALVIVVLSGTSGLFMFLMRQTVVVATTTVCRIRNMNRPLVPDSTTITSANRIRVTKK